MQNNYLDLNLGKIIISAYLHDIGKLLWRGGHSLKGKKYEISHSQYVFDFFNDKNKKYNGFWKEIGLIASLHHAKDFFKYDRNNRWDTLDQKTNAWIVYMADNISARERIDQDNLEDKKEYEHIKHFGLRTPFENIFKIGGLSSTRAYIPSKLDATDFYLTDKGGYFRGINSDASLSKFELNVVKGSEDDRILAGFKQLANDFLLALDDLVLKFNKDNWSGDDIKNCIYQLDILMQNYCTLVPSDAYTSIGDISLYDHTKTTVAIATTLYNTQIYDTRLDTSEVCKNEVLLLAGDFPSIQKYLFGNIKNHKHLAKRLRAKSLTVQLMNEAVIEFILDKLNLFRANVLINAGGKFVILLDKQAQSEIQSIKHSINEFFINQYQGNIKFVLTDKTCRINEIFPDDESIDQQSHCAEIFSHLFSQLSKEKFQTYGLNQLKILFKNKDPKGFITCKYCGLYTTSSDDESEDSICDFCQKEKELGEVVTKKNSICIDYKNGEEFYFDWNFDKGQILVQFNSWENSSKFAISKSMNLYVPTTVQGETKSFEDLAIGNDRNYLCMLKGDIDMMGIILQYGFDYDYDLNGRAKKSTYSVSRLVNFSRMLELFFGKYLNGVLKKESLKNVYTVFSGGDDFVFIVPFEDRFVLIETLISEFHNFVAKNSNIHFSLGLGMFKDKTPFGQVDANTEELLKTAKSITKREMSEHGINAMGNRGLCIYHTDYAKIIDKDWNKKSMDIPRKIDKMDNYNTMIYRLYLSLKQIQALRGNDDINRSSLYHIGARITYMISRNIRDESLKYAMIRTIQESCVDKDKLKLLCCQLENYLYENRL